MFKKLVIISYLIMIAFLNMLPIGFGFFDQTNKLVPLNIQIGNWTPMKKIEDFDESLIDGFFDLFGVETLSELYSNSTFQNIMDAASCTGSGCSAANDYTINNVELMGINYEINGIFTVQAGRRSIGFVRQVDRNLNTSNQPIFEVLPNPTSDSNINYFKAYDIENSLTNNNYSIRLDNQVSITTEQPIANLSSISFYALRGLRIDNSENLANRTLIVEISSNRVNWTQVGSFTSQSPPTNIQIFTENAVSTNFPFYQFNLTQNQINQAPETGYYVRITFNGGSVGSGSNVSRSRIIIDELTYHTD